MSPMANGKQKLELTWTCPDVRQNPRPVGIGNDTNGQDVQKMVHS